MGNICEFCKLLRLFKVDKKLNFAKFAVEICHCILMASHFDFWLEVFLKLSNFYKECFE